MQGRDGMHDGKSAQSLQKNFLSQSGIVYEATKASQQAQMRMHTVPEGIFLCLRGSLGVLLMHA